MQLNNGGVLPSSPFRIELGPEPTVLVWFVRDEGIKSGCKPGKEVDSRNPRLTGCLIRVLWNDDNMSFARMPS